MILREFQFPQDYPAALHLWQDMECGVRVGLSDTLQEIGKKMERDPDLFLVAEQEGHIIGTVIGAFDGRRGMIYHLAVQKEFQRHGVGGLLMSEVEERLHAKGCLKCYLLVFADNSGAIDFYQQRGWREMTEDRIFCREF